LASGSDWPGVHVPGRHVSKWCFSGQGENLFAPPKGQLKWTFQTNSGLLSVPPAPIPGWNIGRREIPKDQEGQVRSTPAVIDGAAYFGSDDGHIYAVDIKTSEEIWRFQTGGEVESSPAVAGGLVLVGSLSNTFFALDQKTGEPRWTFNTGSMVQSSSVVIDGAVLFGSWVTGSGPRLPWQTRPPILAMMTGISTR
jgi:outer membrane protein assembly factor BamB